MTGEQGLRVWPVPCRVELAEKDRLEAARQVMRERFAPLLWHVRAANRAEYWGSVEVLYFPYYAYEEVLATIADEQGSTTTSMLGCMERLTARLTFDSRNPILRLEFLPPRERDDLLARYQRGPKASARKGGDQPPERRFFLSYRKEAEAIKVTRKLGAMLELEFGSKSVFWDEKVPLGANWKYSLSSALNEADTLLAVIGPGWFGSGAASEVFQALKQGKVVIPIVLSHAVNWGDLPEEVREIRGVQVSSDFLDLDLAGLVATLAVHPVATPAKLAPQPLNVDDPQKGRWGSESERSGRRLKAHVEEAGGAWFDVTLVVEPTDERPIEGEVEFHLHPSFLPSTVSVSAHQGRAELKQRAWGAYTVGVIVDGGRTQLELDLADLPDAPKVFRER